MNRGVGRNWRSGGEGRWEGEPLAGWVWPAWMKGERSPSDRTLSAGKGSLEGTVVSEPRQNLDSLTFRSPDLLGFLT